MRGGSLHVRDLSPAGRRHRAAAAGGSPARANRPRGVSARAGGQRRRRGGYSDEEGVPSIVALRSGDGGFMTEGVYEHHLEVTAAAIDANGHANNVEFV